MSGHYDLPGRGANTTFEAVGHHAGASSHPSFFDHAASRRVEGFYDMVGRQVLSEGIIQASVKCFRNHR